MPQKNWFIKTGDFFFKWRNIVFPVILAALFLTFTPPATYFGSETAEELKDDFAWFLVFSGLAFRIATIGWAYIKRGGLNKQVYADKLVTEGFFNMCRNPLYVGNMLIYSGVFIAHGHPVVMIAGIALYWFIYEAIIAAEEYFLRNKFGADYEAYCRAVPRWIPDFSRYKESVKDMSYSFKRAIAKDYTTVFNAIFALMAIELIETYNFYPLSVFLNDLAYNAVMLFIMLLLLATVLFMKKTGRLKKV